MVCRACNYNSEEESEFKQIYIEGTVTFDGHEKDIDIDIKDDSGWRGHYVSLYICPECGTVRAE